MTPNRLPLIQSPTPVHKLERMSDRLGIDLWIKRDDLTGFALGGNKGRKLEYLMPDVLAKAADVVVTSGATQSNFIRQLAVACKVLGVQCAAATMQLPFDGPAGPPVGAPLGNGGNETISRMLEADLREYPNGIWEDLYSHAEDLAQEYESRGSTVYRMSSGGSSPLGALAFAMAGDELKSQLTSIDYIVLATSSGSTQAGLTYSFAETVTSVVGICADPEPEFVDYVADLINELESLTGRKKRWQAEDLDCRLDWVGPGYGVPSKEGDEAIRMLAAVEGIFLDPIYTAKAFAGLLGLAKRGEIEGRVVFWHTGGIPTLFATS